MKKIVSICLLFAFIITAASGTSYAKEKDPLVNYEMTALSMALGEEMDFYSVDEKVIIEKDSEIVFQTEDGTLKKFKAISLRNGKNYLFRFKVDQLGVWKLVELDGEKVESRSRDFTVYKDRKEADKADRAIHQKAVDEANEKADKQKALIWEGKMNVTRIAGKDRYETALKASRYAFKDGSKYAVVATGENFIDGLVGGSLTAQVEAPLLLARKNTISKEVLNEIKRLKPEEIFILGGEGAVSEKVEKDIKALGITVERLAGKDRVETAEKINEKREALLPKAFAKKYVAMVSGTNFPDALTAAPYIGEMAKAGKKFYNILPYIKGRKYPKIDLAIGGKAVVPLNAKDTVGGDNRYHTSLLMARHCIYSHGLGKDADTLIIVDGRNYPDGLTAAALASRQNGIVVLVENHNLTAYNIDLLMEHGHFKNVILMGGEAAVGSGVEDIFRAKVQPPEIYGYRFR